MNCHETETWLLRDETPNRPSPEVRMHLRSCAACRQRFARLVRLIQEVQNAPLPAVPAAARARLFAQLEKTPSAIPIAIPLAAPVARPFSARHLFKAPWTRWAAAAVLCLALGVVIAMAVRPRPDGTDQVVDDDRRDKIDGPVEDRILALHLLLAETFQPDEQLQTLSDMAADVRRETLAMAGKGTADDLRLLAWLHARLLHDGVLRTARGLDSDSKALVASIVADLRKAEKELDSLAQDLPPPSMNSMRQMRLQVREAAVALEGGPDSPAPAAQPPVIVGSRSLLQTLVVSSLQVANEDDPVKRAAQSTEVAGRLADVLAEQGDKVSPERKDNLTKSLEKVMMRGVHGNLAQFDLAKMDDASRKRMEQIHKKAEDAMQKLKPGLLKFSAESRQHLERFQELTKRIQTHQFHKGKGPPWKKPPPKGGGRSR